MKKSISILLFVFMGAGACFGNLPSNPASKNKLSKNIDKAIQISLNCLKNSTNEVGDNNKYPSYATKDLKWKLATSKDWTSGFYPGTLWYAYELSNDNFFKKSAESWTSGIEAEKFNKATHDLGFRFNCSFGNGLRLAAKDSATRRYKEVLLTAAATADSRFEPVIGQYPSNWDKKPLANSVPVVIDVMMNLELLLWAAENGGDPKIRERCISHAKTGFRDLIRKDGSSFHVVRYDKTTGKLLNQGQLQGDTDSSTWTRGHAWMVYGLNIMYRYTKDPQYLEMAMKVADYFIKHLPKDQIANWDFQSKLDHRDASASAIVCSALLELQGNIKDAKKKKYYLTQAEKMLNALCCAPYFSEGKGTNCLLLRSTQYFYNTDNTDVPATFADYYFMEALVRYKKLSADKLQPVK
ncbi:MAG: glycoside hydrolase family 88 protein [Prolixibacteraceae bacterium]